MKRASTKVVRVRREHSIGDKIVEGFRQISESMQGSNSAKLTIRTVTLTINENAMTPTRVRKTRELLGASQAIFAKFLGVAPNTVATWEQGIRKPAKLARRFLSEIAHDPEYWKQRLNAFAAT